MSAGLIERGIKHPTLGHRGPRDFLRTALRLRRLMQSLRPEVIYSFMPVSNVLCTWSAPDWARSRLVWGVRASCMAHPDNGFFPRLALRLERFAATNPTMIIANSEAGAAYHRDIGFPKDAMRVVENSVDTTLFAFDPQRRRTFRTLHNVAESQRIVTISSRIDPIKGYDTFIAAAAAVARERDDVLFWSIGGGDETLLASFQHKANEEGLSARLKWFGEIRDSSTVVSALCASDICVSAAVSEGFPNSVAESLACGLRVVGTDAGDTRRLIGNCGVCVPIGDAESMNRAILRELARTSSRELVRHDFISRFDPDRLMDRHEKLLRGVAAKVTER